MTFTRGKKENKNRNETNYKYFFFFTKLWKKERKKKTFWNTDFCCVFIQQFRNTIWERPTLIDATCEKERERERKRKDLWLNKSSFCGQHGGRLGKKNYRSDYRTTHIQIQETIFQMKNLSLSLLFCVSSKSM